MTITPPEGARATLMILVLGLLAVFPPLAIDMYLAAIGQVAEAMHATDSAAEMSLAIFFLGLCVGQVIVGPLSDAFGRKLPLMGGTLLFTFASAGLLMVDDIVHFNALRFVQAVGACAGMAVGRAIVTDLYRGRQVAKVMTILVTLLTLGPILAPSLGALLMSSLGWRSIFVALVLVGIAALVLTAFFIPETLPRTNRRTGAIRHAFGHFGALATRRRFIVPALVTALMQAPLFAFITGSSALFMGGFGVSSSTYGILFGVIASALIIFAQVNNQLLNRFEPAQIMNGALPALVVAAALLLAVSGTSDLWVLVAAFWVIMGLSVMLGINCMSIAMGGSREAAGLGSAAVGAIQFGTAFTTSSLVALAGTGTALPLGIASLVLSSAACALWFGLYRDSDPLVPQAS